MSISACIIAKDEERNIGRCLNSIKNIVDEIILVDTGSTDYTVEIAEGFGARVIHSNFNNNFSKVRNIALENATKDWILTIDCDEVIGICSYESLNRVLSNKNIVGCCLKMINVIGGKEYNAPYLLRLFRNHNNFYYEGRIHEQILKSIYVKYTENNIAYHDLNLYHYGYDIDLILRRKKHTRNLEIFNSYNDSEKDGFYYFNFANEYFAHEKFLKALELYLKALKCNNNEVNYREFIPANLLRCYYELGRYKEGIEQSILLEKEFFYLRDIFFMKASFYIRLGKSVEARKCYEKYMALSENQLYSSDNYFDKLNSIESLIRNL